MSTKENQNVWFGVAMFLMGLIAGAALTLASGSVNFKRLPTAPIGNQPQAPSAPSVPVVTAQESMMVIAADLGLSQDAFKSCIESDKYDQKISDQLSGGAAAGVTGTPGTLLVSLKTSKARLLSGAQPLTTFKQNIDEMLKDPSAEPAPGSGAAVANNVPPLDLTKDHWRGDRNAQIAMIEYSDYQCPYCKRVHPTLTSLLQEYDGKVLWVYRHYPLYSIHPDALPLARGAECAAELGDEEDFWKFSDQVLSS